MSLADEPELLTLPPEFEGRPYHVRREAFDVASGWLDLEAITDALGLTTSENAHAQAAAHYLATTGNSTAQPHDPPAPRNGVNVGEGGNRGLWAGSPYGDNVARILARLPDGSHRCGRHPAPAPA
jgi:hypothetical protein